MAKLPWVAIYNIFEVVGCGALVFISFILIIEPFHEPRTWLRLSEILISLLAAFFLAMDALELRP